MKERTYILFTVSLLRSQNIVENSHKMSKGNTEYPAQRQDRKNVDKIFRNHVLWGPVLTYFLKDELSKFFYVKLDV